jgi:hypothetical protein
MSQTFKTLIKPADDDFFFLGGGEGSPLSGYKRVKAHLTCLIAAAPFCGHNLGENNPVRIHQNPSQSVLSSLIPTYISLPNFRIDFL